MSIRNVKVGYSKPNHAIIAYVDVKHQAKVESAKNVTREAVGCVSELIMDLGPVVVFDKKGRHYVLGVRRHFSLKLGVAKLRRFFSKPETTLKEINPPCSPST